ncbi:MAG: adenosine kinase [Enterobacterales bacterium]|nr:adenosine kinase [Enterobacterales bacterium]
MTKKYHIYGMGNALVDFEIETSESVLLSAGISKGVMTLIDQQKQDQLFQIFDQQELPKACGGSAANTIMGAQRLGSKCFYSCKVADDETGRFYKQDLLGKGVDSNLAYETFSQGKTGKCLVLITPDADRTMNTFLGITGDIDQKQINEEALCDSEYLYIEGYLAGSPIALEAASKVHQFAKKQGVKTAFSLSDPNIVNFCRDGLKTIIGDGVDILFCNSDEALAYSEAKTLDDAINTLLAICSTLVVTEGKQGSQIVTANQRIRIDAYPVKAVDTNGAGDLFAGAFLHGIGQGLNLEQAGQLASFAASKLVTQFGPRLKQEALEKVKAFAKQLGC